MRLSTGALLAIASAVAYGSLAVFAKLAYATGWGTPPLLVMRFAFASLCVLPFALRASGGWSGFPAAFVFGGLGYTATTALFFPSLRYLPAAVASFLLYLAPVLVAVLAHLFLRERLGVRGMLALALALVGMGVLTMGAWTGTLSLRGILFASGSAVAYAVSIVVSRRIAQGLAWPRAALGVTLGAFTAYFVFSAATRQLAGPAEPMGWVWAIALGTIGMGLPVALFFAALSRLGAGEVSVILTLEPVSTLALAAVFLGEMPGPAGLVGGLLITVAAAIVAWQTPTAPAPHE